MRMLTMVRTRTLHANAAHKYTCRFELCTVALTQPFTVYVNTYIYYICLHIP